MQEKPIIKTANADNRANQRVAVGAALMAVTMVGAAYAAVPLYDLFCRVTGYGGTTQVAEAAPGAVAERMITVRFDASLNRKLPWAFEAPENAVQLPIGESGLAFYSAKNLTDRTLQARRPIMCRPIRPVIIFRKSIVSALPSRFWNRDKASICRSAFLLIRKF